MKYIPYILVIAMAIYILQSKNCIDIQNEYIERICRNDDFTWWVEFSFKDWATWVFWTFEFWEETLWKNVKNILNSINN